MQALGCRGRGPILQAVEGVPSAEGENKFPPDRNGDRKDRELGTPVPGSQQTPLYFKLFRVGVRFRQPLHTWGSRCQAGAPVQTLR